MYNTFITFYITKHYHYEKNYSFIDAASSTPQSETYIDVDFQLSCRTITLPISFSSIVADPNYLMDIHDYLEEQLCGEPNSGGDLKVEEDETNNDIVTP